jgi:hypothetical protein
VIGWDVFESGYRAGQEHDWPAIGAALALFLIGLLILWCLKR